jgi:hypothetical protein
LVPNFISFHILIFKFKEGGREGGRERERERERELLGNNGG